jgi:zinc transporter ZupT
VFIATAFVTCDAFMGWSVATAAVFHELAQEISDYVVLTSPSQANLKPHQALLLNFLSGTSVMLGALPSPLGPPPRGTQHAAPLDVEPPRASPGVGQSGSV